MQITNYQCPNCTGPLHFHGGEGKLQCEYCGTSYENEFIEELYAGSQENMGLEKKQWDMTEARDWSQEEAKNLRAYSCPSCGAELIMDHTTAASSCPYCNNPTIIAGQFSGNYKPDFVIPFKLDKDSAIKALKNYYKGKKFLPKSFSKDNHMEEVKGVYVPFWLFDGKAYANAEFNGSKVHSYRSGDEEITVNEYYQVIRQGSLSFEKIPVDGSVKMPDAHMDAIEPFDYSEIKPFSSAYLPGFMAEKYSMDSEDCASRANKRIEESTKNIIKDSAVGYKSLLTEHFEMKLSQGAVKYALLPVWLLSTKWKGESFLFAMNGQTGKFIGDLPIDKALYRAWFAKISLPLMALLGALMFLGGN